MNIQKLKQRWDFYGKTDPLSAVCKPRNRDEPWQAEELFRMGKEEIEKLMEYIHRLNLEFSRRKALDFGCGIGRLTQAMAPFFDQVYGVDIAPSMIELANKYNRYPDKCLYSLNDQDHLRIFPDNSFDFIYSNITLQHMEPRHSRKYIREFLRLLVPYGLLIFQQPSEPKPIPHRSFRSLRRFLILLTPKFLLRLYYHPKGICLEDVLAEGLQMKMYGIKREEIVIFLEGAGGKIVDIVENESSGPNWTSFQYCVTKQGIGTPTLSVS